MIVALSHGFFGMALYLFLSNRNGDKDRLSAAMIVFSLAVFLFGLGILLN